MSKDSILVLRIVAGVIGGLFLLGMCAQATGSNDQETCIYWNDGTTSGTGC